MGGESNMARTLLETTMDGIRICVNPIGRAVFRVYRQAKAKRRRTLRNRRCTEVLQRLLRNTLAPPIFRYYENEILFLPIFPLDKPRMTFPRWTECSRGAVRVKAGQSPPLRGQEP